MGWASRHYALDGPGLHSGCSQTQPDQSLPGRRIIAGVADSPHLRRAESDDAEALAELSAATFPAACPDWMPAEAIDQHIAIRLNQEVLATELADQRIEYYLAFASGTQTYPLGFVMLTDRRETGANLSADDSGLGMATTEGEFELQRIYVREQAYGSGIAQALMDLAKRRARQVGAARLVLGTSKANDRALAFYRRAGFEVAGQRHFLVAEVPNEDWLLIWPCPPPDAD